MKGYGGPGVPEVKEEDIIINYGCPRPTQGKMVGSIFQ